MLGSKCLTVESYSDKRVVKWMGAEATSRIKGSGEDKYLEAFVPELMLRTVPGEKMNTVLHCLGFNLDADPGVASGPDPNRFGLIFTQEFNQAANRNRHKPLEPDEENILDLIDQKVEKMGKNIEQEVTRMIFQQTSPEPEFVEEEEKPFDAWKNVRQIYERR